MIAGVAALVVSKPAVKVAPRVRGVESSEVGLLCVLEVFAGGPPHVGVALQGLQPLPGPLLGEELSTPGQRSGQSFT